jgi:hypothetical protein
MSDRKNAVVIMIVLTLPFYSIAQLASDKEIVPYDVKRVSRLTGRSETEEQLPNPNQTHERYNVGGTDLGIAWDMGNGKTGFFFGDTYGQKFRPVKEGGPGVADEWRSNVLGISYDRDFNDGITFNQMISRQLIYSPHITNGTGSHTAIPTAVIHAAGKDYVHYMDVRKWLGPGRWITNYSALYQSVDGGIKWNACKQVYFGAQSNFAQVGYAKKDGYVYMAGTISGRAGGVYLARFKETDILNQSAYQYWNSANGWGMNNEKDATPIIDGPAGELSIYYHKRFKRWIVTYLSEKANALVMRDAIDLTSAWSKEKVLVSAVEYPGLYGPFIIPSKPDENSLYFTMSMWWPYNVFVMKASLKLAN